MTNTMEIDSAASQEPENAALYHMRYKQRIANDNMHPQVLAAFEMEAKRRMEANPSEMTPEQHLERIIGEKEYFPTREQQDALVRRAERNVNSDTNLKNATQLEKEKYVLDSLPSMMSSGASFPGGSTEGTRPTFAQIALQEEQEAALWQANKFLLNKEKTGNPAVDNILKGIDDKDAKIAALKQIIIKDPKLLDKAFEGHEKAQVSKSHVAELKKARNATSLVRGIS